VPLRPTATLPCDTDMTAADLQQHLTTWNWRSDAGCANAMTPPQLRRARSPPGRRASGALIQRFWRGYGRAIHQQLLRLPQNIEPHPKPPNCLSFFNFWCILV
jgi:hypothetical protein